MLGVNIDLFYLISYRISHVLLLNINYLFQDTVCCIFFIISRSASVVCCLLLLDKIFITSQYYASTFLPLIDIIIYYILVFILGYSAFNWLILVTVGNMISEHRIGIYCTLVDQAYVYKVVTLKQYNIPIYISKI
jgi:hypothetical protein